MDLIDKRKKLEELRKEIIEEFLIKSWMDVWFYPRYKGVMGYLGTQDIMFVGLNPSYSCFPTQHDEFFYNELKRVGFQNAHLTDIIKIRSRCKEVKKYLRDYAIFRKNLEFLLREFNIVQPKIIVAVGSKSGNLLKKNFPEKREKTYHIPHYSVRKTHNFEKRIQEFKKELNKVKVFYSKLI